MMKALLLLGFLAVLFCSPAFAGPPMPPPIFLIPLAQISIGPSQAQTQSALRAAVQLNRTEKEMVEQQLWTSQTAEQQDWGDQVMKQQLLVNETLRQELKEAGQKENELEQRRGTHIVVGE